MTAPDPDRTPDREPDGGGSALADRLEAARRRLGRLRYLDAVIVAALAAGFHFYWNVPDKVIAVPGDQGVPKPKRTTKPGRHTPRTPEQLANLRTRYTKHPFTVEPKNGAFARYATPRLRRVVASARARAFQGAPEPSPMRTTDFECRTVRCRFRTRDAAGPHEVDLLADALREVKKDGKPVFADVQVTPAVAKDAAGYDAWIVVTLARDDFDATPAAPAAGRRRVPKVPLPGRKDGPGKARPKDGDGA